MYDVSHLSHVMSYKNEYGWPNSIVIWIMVIHYGSYVYSVVLNALLQLCEPFQSMHLCWLFSNKQCKWIKIFGKVQTLNLEYASFDGTANRTASCNCKYNWNDTLFKTILKGKTHLPWYLDHQHQRASSN